MTPADQSHATRPDPALELDAFLAAFEAAASDGASPDLSAFLPPPDHPLYTDVLRELVRVDLEFAWSRGTRRRVEDYRTRFPELFRDQAIIHDLAREEYRLRKAAGETPNPREYRDRLGVDLGSATSELHSTHQLNGVPVDWPDDRAPTIGDTIPPGYHLTGELGSGAFGRVFLAREMGLGGRPVAVKLSAQLADEPLTLARLQHTNIVPVYAAHRVGKLTALVMPFVGRTTLADVIATFRAGRVPQSGHDLASTLTDRAGSTAGDNLERPEKAEPAPAPGKSRAALDALERMTFVEAVLWIGAELADGLSHAHERGVLHRDIKPANVLFTDDGRPMLLDFNLAALSAGRVCGTPGYMAPEQLAAATQERGMASVQTDIYALGLVLVELLAGRTAFEEPRGRWEEILPKMLAARRQTLLKGLTFQSDVTPGVRAILAKCLDSDPAKRYANAADLREDLNRQRTHRPLKFAPEGSVRERIRKWTRRHPRLSSGATITAVAVLVIGLVTAAYLVNRQRLGLREAELAQAGLRDGREFAQSGMPFSTVGEWRAVRSAALVALAPYKVESDNWVNGPLVTRLSEEEERSEVRRDAAQLMFRAAEASTVIAKLTPSERDSLLSDAVEWNRRARIAYPGNPPRPFLLRYAGLLRATGRSAEADTAVAEAMSAAEPVTDDPTELGFAALYANNYTEAATKLRAAAHTGPPRYAVWMGLAAAEQRLARYSSQIDALSAAAALRPSSPWPYFHRGNARLELKDYSAAIADFDRFLELAPDDTDGFLNRGIAKLLNRDARGAIADLDQAERLGSTRTRLYAVRVQAKVQLGDNPGADRDRAACLAKMPTDPMSWCARGELKIASDPAGALADFDAALAIDPDLINALQDKASVLSENLNRPADAIKVLDRVLELSRDSISDRAGRAVLLARLGRTADARLEVEMCARRAESALILYQLASAALVAGDKPRGLDLLRSVLRKDPTLGALMPSDPDLKLVWKDATFLNLITAAGTLSRN